LPSGEEVALVFSTNALSDDITSTLRAAHDSSDMNSFLLAENEKRMFMNTHNHSSGVPLLGPLRLLEPLKGPDKEDIFEREAQGIAKKKSSYRRKKKLERNLRQTERKKETSKFKKKSPTLTREDFSDNEYPDDISDYYIDLTQKKTLKKFSHMVGKTFSEVEKTPRKKSVHPNARKGKEKSSLKKKKKEDARKFRAASKLERQAKIATKKLAKLNISTESGPIEADEDWYERVESKSDSDSDGESYYSFVSKPAKLVETLRALNSTEGLASNVGIIGSSYVDIQESSSSSTSSFYDDDEEIFDDEGFISVLLQNADIGSRWVNILLPRIQRTLSSLNIFSGAGENKYLGDWIFYGSTIIVLCIAFVLCKDYSTLIKVMAALAVAYGLVKYTDKIKDKFDILLSKCWPFILKMKDSSAVLFDGASGVSMKDRIIAFMATIIESDLVRNVQTFFLSLISLKLFDKDVGQTIRKFVPGKNLTVLEATFKIVESSLTLLEMSVFCIRDMSLVPLLGSDNICYDYMNRSSLLISKSEFTYSGLPVEGYVCERELFDSLKSHSRLGDALLETMHSKDKRFDRLVDSQAKVKRCMHKIKSSILGRKRIQPYGIILAGPPGIGKSKLVLHALKTFSRVRGRDFHESMMYSKPRTSDYYEKYDPIVQPYIHFPEVGNMSKDMIGKVRDNTLLEINNLSDSLPCPVNTAFDDKGDVYAFPECLIIDTNNIGLHAKETMHDPKALNRRFKTIDIRVLPEFRVDPKDDRSVIDSAKSFNSEREYLDKYMFYVKEYKEKPGTREGKLLTAHKFDNIQDFTDYMSEDMTRYIENEFENMRRLEEELAPEAKTEAGPVPATSISMKAKVAYAYFKCYVLHNPWYMATKQFLYMFILNMARVFGLLLVPSAGFDVRMEFVAIFWMIVLCILPYNVLFYNFLVVLFFRSHEAKLKRLCYRFRIVDDLDTRYKRAKVKINYYLFNGNFINPLKALKYADQIVFCSKIASACTIALIPLVYYIKQYRKKVITQSSSFSDRNEEFVKMEKFEDDNGYGRSIERIPSKINPRWNNHRVVNHRALFTEDCTKLDAAFASNVLSAVIYYKSGDKVMRNQTRLFGICGDYAIVNKHAIHDPNIFKISICRGLDVSDEKILQEINLDLSQCADITDDLILVRLIGYRFKNIMKHVSKAGANYALARASIRGDRISLSKSLGVVVASNWNNDKIRFSAPLTYTYSSHYAGMCGTPVFAEINGGSCFVGIHCAAAERDECFAMEVSYELLSRAINIVKSNSHYVEVLSFNYIDKLVSPSAKSLFRYEEMPGVVYLGYNQKMTLAKGKSRLKKTSIADGLDELFFNHFNGFIPSIEYVKPVMGPKKVHGEYINPYNLAARQLGIMSKSLDPVICSKTIDVVFDRVFNGLLKKGVHTLSPVDMRTAINGAKEDFYFRRINPTTGAGYSLDGKKDKYLQLCDENDDWLREPTSEIVKRVADRIESYMCDSSEGFVFQCHLKDEPRDKEKVKVGKTRVFYAMDLPDLIIARMHLGPIYTLMVQFSDLFCTGVGIDMHSAADDLYNKLIDFALNMMEGYYRYYDVTMPSDIAYMANTVIYKLAEKLGYSPAALHILKGILSDLAFPVLAMLNDLFYKCGNQPSGKYGTAEDNSLRGLLMLVYGFIKVCPDLDFFEHVLPITYGDDVVAAVKDDVADRFNNLTYQKIVEDDYGMGFTATDKGSDLTKFVHHKEISFLKRTFVKHEALDKFVAPLALDSLYKALQWMSPSSAVTELDQLMSTTTSILWEAFFHLHDEASFMAFRSDLMALCEGSGISQSVLVKGFPTYEMLLDNFSH